MLYFFYLGGRLGFCSGEWEEISPNLKTSLHKGLSLPIKKSHAGRREEEFQIVLASSFH